MKEGIIEINEIQAFSGTGDGGVKPSPIFIGEHVICEVALVDEDSIPLPALRFVASDGIINFPKGN